VTNWYKNAFELNNFTDRNAINSRIHLLRDMFDQLKLNARVVWQNATDARKFNFAIANHKAMSSYPTIRGVLLEADDVALDSPSRFATLCFTAADEIDARIKKLVENREDFINKDLPKKTKGWIDGK
jgi:hypothetical protein